MFPLLNFQPISNITLLGVLQWYIVYTVLGLAFAIPIHYVETLLGFKPKDVNISPVTGGVVGLFEEGIFRGFPLAFFPELFIPMHYLWAILHGRPSAIAFVGVSGLLFARLWLGGLWFYAVLIHVVHNFFVLYLARSSS